METRRLLAVGVVADDLSVGALVRYGRVHVVEAEAALAEGRRIGLVRDDGTIDAEQRARLVADLPVEEAAEIHAAVARQLMAEGPDRVIDAVRHARAAGALVPLEELVDLAERAGRLNLDLHDYAAAYDLLEVAAEFDTAADPSRAGRRLCDLAAAADGLGRIDEHHDLLARAVHLGALADDIELVVGAATAHAQPADWYTGNLRTTALLARSADLPLTTAQQVRVDAARAVAEMRIPIEPVEGQQVAWVTRPAVAHPFADRALEASQGCEPEVRAVATWAWRTVHRAPDRLADRRSISTTALDLAQQVRRPDLQVEDAVWLAVDALESGDRPLFDEALSVARWVAESDGNPRLRWRAATLAAGAAHLDGHVDEAARLRMLARTIAEPLDLPGWLGAEMLLLGEEVVARSDPAELPAYLYDEDSPVAINPIGRAVLAEIRARTGDHEGALRMARRSFGQLDPEASHLLLATRCAAVAVLTESTPLATELVTVLEPWRDHVSIDSHGWWCDGPVSLWLAELHLLIGRLPAALECLDLADPVVAAINDTRGRVRSARVRAELDRAGVSAASSVGRAGASTLDELTERERNVLALLVEGRTNREIAAELLFSLGTIRADTVSIYRKLGVKGRTDAVAHAVTARLAQDPERP